MFLGSPPGTGASHCRQSPRRYLVSDGRRSGTSRQGTSISLGDDQCLLMGAHTGFCNCPVFAHATTAPQGLDSGRTPLPLALLASPIISHDSLPSSLPTNASRRPPLFFKAFTQVVLFTDLHTYVHTDIQTCIHNPIAVDFDS